MASADNPLSDSIDAFRRRLLQASGGGLALLAGCAGDAGDTPTETASRTPTTAATETPTATATGTETPTATATDTATPEEFDTTDISEARLNARLFAVPSTDPTIDGTLDDWDRSGMIDLPDEVGFAPTGAENASFALMYDGEALYLGGRVEDPTPLQNLHDPEVEPERAWEGDACQFRMALDPDLGFPIPQDQWNSDRIVHALLWQYSEDEEPYLQLHYGFDYESPYGREDGLVDLDAFDAAYRTFDEDGTTGYTFEYRIPWETLHASEAGGPPGPGDLVAGTVQFNWDGGKGLKADRYKYGLLSDSGFPYQRPSPWGKIVMAERNDLPGSLVESSASIPKPLPMSVDYSLPTGGEVTLALYDDDDRFVKHIAVEAPREAGDRTAKFDGLDAFDRPLDPGDYTLKGLVHDPLELQFVTSVHNSGTPPHKTEDGTGGWGADHGVPTTAAAMGDDVLLAWSVSETGDGIIRVDSTGDKQWGADRTSEYLAQHPSDDRYFGAGGHGTYSWTGAAVFDGQNGRQLKFSESGRTAAIPEADDDVDNTVTGLATGGDRLYVAFGDRDLVAVNDVDTGELLETHAVPSPQRVAASDDRALVVSGATGHVHDPTAEHEGGAPPVVVTTQIEDPRGIALDDRGRIYVANGGDRQNVTVHDADGSLVSEIGANGGRPLMGTFEPDGMLKPGGIAIGAEGRLWVAETLDAPKRHSVWDTRTGDLVDHYFGASAYSAGAHMEPSRPDEVFCHNCLWNVDLDTGEKEIVSTLFRREDPNAPTPRTGWRFPPETVIAENGHQYSWAGGQAQRQSLFLYKRERDTFHPLLGFFNLGDGDRPYPALSDTDQLPPGNYAWVDENGDDLIQADEVTRLDDPDTKNYNESIPWIHTVDEQLNLIDNEGIWRPESVDDDGVPTYDFESGPDTFPIDGVRGYFDNIHPTDDSFFTVSQADGSISEPDQTPGFSRWSRDGDLMWGFTNTARWANVLQTGGGDPGDMYGLTAHLGVAGGFTGAATYFGDSHITTTDGVYVASIFRKSGRVDYDTRKAETFTGQLVQPEGTDRYFHLGGDQDGRIVEVHGLNSVQRLDDRTYTVTEEMSERAQRAFEQFQRAKAGAQSLAIVRGQRALASDDGVTVRVDQSNAFTAKLAYDEENLYVRYQVESEAPLTNGVEPQAMFTGGNCIDVQLATGGADPERTEPAPGDIRLLFTRKGGEPFGMVYEPEVAGFSGDPITLESPVDEESFDRIEEFEAFEMRHEETSAGFEATVTIPLDTIDLELEPASTVRGDVGYIFDGSQGETATARAYWSNDGFEANVVDDVPDESRLNPEHWGDITVE